MQSSAADVDTYLATVPQERQEVLRALRRLCLSDLPGHEEGMDYGMPCYSRNGAVAFAFASQKRYISLYGLDPAAVAAERAALAGASFGKSCVRFSRPGQIDLDVVARLLRATAAAQDGGCSSSRL